MKKCFAIILTLALTLSLVACGGEPMESTTTPTTTPTTPAEVQLTTSNIDEYLAFEFDYSKVERENKLGISFGYTDITMKSYAVSAGSFKNVEITVAITLDYGWTVSSSDEAYDKENNKVLVCSFRLPTSGEYTSTHDLIATMVYSDPNSNNVRYTITSVSGTFIPS